MKALVVYESAWGNTAAVAAAIADGMGEGARAVHTDEAPAEAVQVVDMIVAGAPIFGFTLPTEGSRRSAANSPAHRDHPPDFSHPSMRAWLANVPAGNAAFATFETKLGWSPGSAAKRISKRLTKAGYSELAEPEPFIVTGTYGPLADGELERARAWGEELVRLLGAR